MDDPFSFTASKRQDRQGAASRQKSCNACVRGKRRCDKTMPRCTRCAAKGLECVYAKLPPSSGRASTTTTTTATATSSPTEESSMSSAATHADDYSMAGAFDMPPTYDDMHLDSTPATATATACGPSETLELDPSLDFNIADLIQGHGTFGGDWGLPPFLEEPKMNFPVPTTFQMPVLLPTGKQPLQQHQQTPIRDLMILRNSLKQGDCLSSDLLLVYDKRKPVGFVVDWLKNVPVVFARTRHLPFIHPRLYTSSLPRSMMAAFAACAAYSGRTEENKAWVLKLVADTCRDITNEGKLATTPLEKVARVQAFTIMDTIRLFDGDIALRSSAERESDMRKTWLLELVQVQRELEAEEGVAVGEAKRSEPPKSWESWILAETVRRTNMIAMASQCIFYILKNELPDPDMWLTGNAFTASSHLWKAQSPAEFFRAWREKPQWWIENMIFDTFWQYARPEDADEFTELLLTTRVGPDAMDHFMPTKTVST